MDGNNRVRNRASHERGRPRTGQATEGPWPGRAASRALQPEGTQAAPPASVLPTPRWAWLSPCSALCSPNLPHPRCDHCVHTQGPHVHHLGTPSPSHGIGTITDEDMSLRKTISARSMHLRSQSLQAAQGQNNPEYNVSRSLSAGVWVELMGRTARRRVTLL